MKYNDLIPQVNTILSQYTFQLTLRQVYYRLVAAGQIPNQRSSYNGLSAQLVKARENGDVTATALYLCGEGVPSYFDGRVLREAVSAGWLEAHPVISDQRDLPKIIDDAERSERIGEIVARHLAARGYAD